MARLVLEHEGYVLRDYPLYRGGITIGRGKDNTVMLSHPEVSGYHARIDKKGPDYILTDLQSTNGTLVNGRKVFSHRLSHGDRLSVGKNTLLFIGTEKVKIDALEKSIPLNSTIILGGLKHRKTAHTEAAIFRENRTSDVKTSSHPGLLLMAACALVGILVAVGVPTLKNEDFTLNRIFRTTRQNVTPTDKGAPTPEQEKNRPILLASSAVMQGQARLSAGEDISPSMPSSGENHHAQNGWDQQSDIEAIVWSNDTRKSFVVISGMEFRTGESFQGATITKIGRDYIVLQSPQGESITRLTLY
jgi:pSer/pThr/pTyr-binding forkhead associated (FHA) protein